MVKYTYKNEGTKAIFVGDVVFAPAQEREYPAPFTAFSKAVENGVLKLTVSGLVEELPAETFNVLLERNGHGKAPKSFRNVKKGETVTPDPLEDIEGWKFKGWFKDKDCTEAYTPAPVTKDFTLYAKWEEA